MIHVIATIDLNPGCRAQYLEILRANIPAVRAEKGCIRYEPAADIESGIGAQGPARPDTVVLLESWESLEALKEHLKMPHMAAYREKVKAMVRQVGLQVLRPA